VSAPYAPLLALALILQAAASQGAESPPTAPAPAVETSPRGAIEGIAEATIIPNDDRYRIGVEDLLLISVWREPDLTREVPVRPDGKISLPLIQDVQAAGKTPSELGEEITRRLREFLSSPAVTVVVREVNSLKIYLLGEVVKPGPVTLRSEVRLLQAISMAGGVTPFGGRNGVLIYRKTPELGERVIKLSYRDIVAGKSPENNLVLEPGDTIVVH
jgi:polysaccharide export outer membrane protein